MIGARRRFGGGVGTVVLMLLAVSLWLVPAEADAAGLPGLRITGARLLDTRGHRVALRGVNRSGTEYACVQGFGIFDGPSDEASVQAIASWHVNFVRLLLNEDCWLGINGVKGAFSGARYRQAITDYVRLLHRHGIYAELSLAWGAPGRMRARSQPRAPDADHSPTMWASMARTFRGNTGVVLAPWGEPVVTPRCLLRGGSPCPRPNGTAALHYRTAGMQQAVNVMRAAGYRGPIAIPGINYANDMSHWLAFRPRDPRHQLIAEAHVYGKNACSSVSCFNQTMAPVARRVPLIFGETGETYDASSCDSTNISTFLGWADDHHVGYAAWTWDTWGNCHALISNYQGDPANTYGAFVKGYLAGLASGPARKGGVIHP
jgi:endoglucanase